MAKKIDDVDKRILQLVSEDPHISQVELSDRLKISQPAVSMRVRKLEERGALTHLIGIDVKKAQLFLAKMDLATSDVEGVLSFLNMCPIYLNSFLTSGRFNLTVLLLGENIRSIMSCVDSHLRKNPLIKDMEFNLVVTPIRDFVVPIKPNMDKKNATPCGADCGSCTLYSNDRCLGCPVSTHYKGDLL